MTQWARKAARYAGSSLVVVTATFGLGWPMLGAAGRRSLLFAVGVAVVVQWVTFGVLAGFRPGTPVQLAAWVGGTLVRFAVVGVTAFWVAGREELDLVVTLLALVGMLFVLLLLEPWALREPANSGSKG